MPLDIKMVDLRAQYLRIQQEIDDAIERVLTSTAFINGPEVEAFAKKLSEYLGGSHVVPCANGTDALQLAFMALELQPGDEVILPVHTYVATAEVIALLRLKPVFVDVDPVSFNIDVKQVEQCITKNTKVIVPVHLYGQCADMEGLLALASKYNLHVVEDTAQALGADYIFKGGERKKAGTIGTIGTTSFFPSKNLGCFGDGGAVICSDPDLASSIKMIANHGQRKKYHHERVGVNSRLDSMQAAVLLVKLNYLNEYSAKRNAVADFYDAHITTSSVELPRRSAFSTHGFHQYTLKADRRDELKKHLEKRGIPTMIYYPIPLHLQPAYRQNDIGVGSFPVTERLSKTVISLPIHTEMTTDELAYISASVNSFYH